MFASVAALVALALFFDFTNGFHDAANSIATVVATRAMPARWAVAFSAAFNFLAYFVVGTAVADTVGKVVRSPYAGAAVVMAALVSAVSWNYLTWWVGMPSSSSHALIGGLVGAGLSAGWLSAVNWGEVGKTALAVVASPLVAFGVAFLATFLVGGLQRVTRWHDDSRTFKAVQVVSAAALSFGHGANDAQKTMGVIAALLLGAGYTSRPAGATQFPVPEWVALSAYSAIALGTLWGGWKIIETMGLRITRLHASSAVAANVGAVSAIFGATGLGIPISTTHAAASSVVGAGVASGRGVHTKVVTEMLGAWVLTIPSTLLLGFLMHRITQLPTVPAVVLLTVVLAVLGGLIAYATAHSLRASDLEAELPDEDELAKHARLHPRLRDEDRAA